MFLPQNPRKPNPPTPTPTPPTPTPLRLWRPAWAQWAWPAWRPPPGPSFAASPSPPGPADAQPPSRPPAPQPRSRGQKCVRSLQWVLIWECTQALVLSLKGNHQWHGLKKCWSRGMNPGLWSPKTPLGWFSGVIPFLIPAEHQQEHGTVNGIKHENPLSPVGLTLTHTQLTIWQKQLENR